MATSVVVADIPGYRLKLEDAGDRIIGAGGTIFNTSGKEWVRLPLLPVTVIVTLPSEAAEDDCRITTCCWPGVKTKGDAGVDVTLAGTPDSAIET